MLAEESEPLVARPDGPSARNNSGGEVRHKSMGDEKGRAGSDFFEKDYTADIHSKTRRTVCHVSCTIIHYLCRIY
jgi:hypothetical protein